jgi:hypothetical protein
MSDNPFSDEEPAAKPIVTKSEDYPSPSKVSIKPSEYSEESESDEEWETREDVVFNVERMVEELLHRETAKLVAELSQQKKPVSNSVSNLAGVQP